MVWNNQQHPIVSAPLPEVHAYSKNKPKFNNGSSKNLLMRDDHTPSPGAPYAKPRLH